MKISFICGSLASGQDGVGDYTRRLASEVAQSGHACQLVSLNDSEDSVSRDAKGIEIVRHQDALHPEKSSIVEAAVARWDPDWISLQFVCFAFHPKGFTHKLTALIRNLRVGRRLDIMFHELWVGEQPSLPLKHKVMGRIQQWLILSAIQHWKPDRLHTSNPLYQYVLARHGYKAERLPIFGNIPIAPATAGGDFHRKPDERIVLFPFSQRHDWNVEATLQRLDRAARTAGVRLKLVQIGRLRSGQQHWDRIEHFAGQLGWQCRRLGPQPETILSQWMQAADLGISSAHIHLADKSGAAVAMHEHGLPVICTITEPVSKSFKEAPLPESGLYSFFDDDATLADLLRDPPKRPPQTRLPIIAGRWLEHLQASKSPD